MTLHEQFSDLQIPLSGNKKLFNASTLSQFAFAKIAVNNDGFPVVLISSKSDGTYLSQKNVRLNYLELAHNIECKISESGTTQFSNFSVIIFKSDEKYLQYYFLEIAETLLNSLSTKPTQKEVLNTFKGFVEIFRSLSDPPSKTVQGLWAELFIIENSENPEILLNYWHDIPQEKFDFNADIEKIEVKSSNNMDRVHIFASEQLNPPIDKQVIIASLFVKQSSRGNSIANLTNSILEKIGNPLLSDKLFSIVCKTLGNTVEQSMKVKYDYELAKNSVRFYRTQDISKIEKIDIPNKVTEVKYKSDLTEVKPINPNEIETDGKLFEAL